MSLLDDLSRVQTRKPSLPEWLTSLKPEERKAFESAIADTTFPVDALIQIVRKHGGSTTAKSVEAMRAAHVSR